MEDDDEEQGGMYDNGHWEWDNKTNELAFISDLPPEVVETITIQLKAPTGTIEFRDNVDLFEQIRFRRRYQRKLKPDESDIITLQDVKDIALFTAPFSIMSPALINMLHLPTTERFLRALICFCQYYLQVSAEMADRIRQMETKVRTEACEILENKLREDLSDLRLLVGKEYCTMLIGGGDTRRFHHMGAQKKRKSLSDKDARLFETLIRMCVQIVWLALGRVSFNQIELEVNRMFKSEIFNNVEHNLRTGYVTNMSREERNVLLGRCVRRDKKMNTRSPLMNEVTCYRPVDYRLMGLGVIDCPQTNPRLQYFLMYVAGPEDQLQKYDISLGIIGLSRSLFDTMLCPLPGRVGKGKSSKSVQSVGVKTSTTSRHFSTISKSSQSTKIAASSKLYPNIFLPSPESKEPYYPPHFPTTTIKARPCSDVQRRRWLNRLTRMLQGNRKA